MLDGTAGYAPAVVAELVDVVSAIEPETGARMRRRLGEVLPQLWAEGAARARAGKHSPGDPFTDCVRAAYERSGE